MDQHRNHQLEWEGRVAWLVPFAHGTPTIKLWSFDVRSWGLIQATPLREKRASLEGRVGSSPLPFVLAEAAQSECAPSMRAVKDSLAAPLGEKV
jgi:hypothetical protein